MRRGSLSLTSLFFHRTVPRTWEKRLRSTAAGLGELSASTEEEFLSLGRGLQVFSGRSRDLSARSSSIAALMAGTGMSGAMAGFRQILEEAQDLGRDSRQGADVLKAVLERLGELQQPLAGFARIVRNLRILCTFVKIESARLECGDTGFDTLSEDVGRLAATIAAKSSDLFEQSASLTAAVAGSLRKIGDFERTRQCQARSIIDGASGCLRALTDRHALSVATMEDVAARWTRITGDIGEVVSSLQFHDITRQRIEHVAEALAEITDRTAATPSGAPRGSVGVADVVAVCELQRAQLDHARQEVLSAIARIAGSLRDIAGHVGEMCRETRSLVAAADGGGSPSSFLSSLEESFSAVTDSIAEYGRLGAELGATIDHAVRTIGAMSTFVGDIEKIGIEIRMIGLNACVRAAHVGERGAALGVLADSIHQLSSDTAGLTDALARNLKAVIHSAAELNDRQTAAAQDRQHLLAQEVARLMEPLKRLDGETLTLLHGITAQGDALADDITAASAGIRVHEQIDRGIEDVIAGLDSFITGMKPMLSRRRRQDAGDGIGALAGRYTMHSERQVHQSVAAGGTAAALALAAPALAGADAAAPAGGDGREDLGDNVELF